MGLGAGALVVIGGKPSRSWAFLTVTTGAPGCGGRATTDFSENRCGGPDGICVGRFFKRPVDRAGDHRYPPWPPPSVRAATAQLGAMRINDEIDALEVMGIRSIAFLASTRVIAGLVVVIPLYCVGGVDVVRGGALWPLRFFYGQVDWRLRPLLQNVS